MAVKRSGRLHVYTANAREALCPPIELQDSVLCICVGDGVCFAGLANGKLVVHKTKANGMCVVAEAC